MFVASLTPGFVSAARESSETFRILITSLYEIQRFGKIQNHKYCSDLYQRMQVSLKNRSALRTGTSQVFSSTGV